MQSINRLIAAILTVFLLLVFTGKVEQFSAFYEIQKLVFDNALPSSARAVVSLAATYVMAAFAVLAIGFPQELKHRLSMRTSRSGDYLFGEAFWVICGYLLAALVVLMLTMMSSE